MVKSKEVWFRPIWKNPSATILLPVWCWQAAYTLYVSFLLYKSGTKPTSLALFGSIKSGYKVKYEKCHGGSSKRETEFDFKGEKY